MAKPYRIFTPANFITFAGILLGGGAYYLLWVYLYQTRDMYHFFGATLCFLVAILTDFVDGKVARFFEEVFPDWGISPFGEILDPFRDKILAGIILVINWQLGIVFICIEMVSFYAALLVRNKAGYHLVTPTSKAVTFFQLPLILFLIFGTHFFPEFVEPLFLVILFLTFLRPISYFRQLSLLDKK